MMTLGEIATANEKAITTFFYYQLGFAVGATGAFNHLNISGFSIMQGFAKITLWICAAADKGARLTMPDNQLILTQGTQAKGRF